MLRYPGPSDALKVAVLAAACALLSGSFDTSAKPDPVRRLRTGSSRGCSVSTLAGDRGFGRAAHEHAYFDDDLTRPSLQGPTTVVPTQAASLVALLPDAPPGFEPPPSRLLPVRRSTAPFLHADTHRLPPGRAPPLA